MQWRTNQYSPFASGMNSLAETFTNYAREQANAPYRQAQMTQMLQDANLKGAETGLKQHMLESRKGLSGVYGDQIATVMGAHQNMNDAPRTLGGMQAYLNANNGTHDENTRRANLALYTGKTPDYNTAATAEHGMNVWDKKNSPDFYKANKDLEGVKYRANMDASAGINAARIAAESGGENGSMFPDSLDPVEREQNKKLTEIVRQFEAGRKFDPKASSQTLAAVSKNAHEAWGEKIDTARSDLIMLNRMQNALDKITTGPGQEAVQDFNAFVNGFYKLATGEELSSMEENAWFNLFGSDGKRMALSITKEMKGSQSDKELNFAISVYPGLGKSNAANKLIIENLLDAARFNKLFYQELSRISKKTGGLVLSKAEYEDMALEAVKARNPELYSKILERNEIIRKNGWDKGSGREKAEPAAQSGGNNAVSGMPDLEGTQVVPQNSAVPERASEGVTKSGKGFRIVE